MKSILFHIGSFRAGGAEKSLVSLLNLLPKDDYNIDVIVFNNSGIFSSHVPDNVTVRVAPYPYRFLSISPKNIREYLNYSLKYLLVKLIGLIYSKCNKKLSLHQALWKIWRKYIPVYDRKYDVAVSYLEGLTNYFVIDKVVADKKILWIHNEYNKLQYSPKFDSDYFSKADAVVTISDICKQDLIRNFPELQDKFHVLENISDSKVIQQKSQISINDETFNSSVGLKILSVGRLTSQKNYQLALKAAKILLNKQIDFNWFIIGEGNLRLELEKLAKDLSVDGVVHFIGIRENPYPYMKQADIIAMSSLFEGKSIVIDEAKILCKPIVSVNYPTVKDNIEDHVTGIITEMTPESLAKGIIKLYNDDDLRKELQNNLMTEVHRGDDQINHYLKLFE